MTYLEKKKEIGIVDLNSTCIHIQWQVHNAHEKQEQLYVIVFSMEIGKTYEKNLKR